MKFYIYVIGLEGSFNIDGELNDETKLLDCWLENLLHCFERNIDCKNKKLEISPLQYKNQELLENIQKFIQLYGDDIPCILTIFFI